MKAFPAPNLPLSEVTIAHGQGGTRPSNLNQPIPSVAGVCKRGQGGTCPSNVGYLRQAIEIVVLPGCDHPPHTIVGEQNLAKPRVP